MTGVPIPSTIHLKAQMKLLFRVLATQQGTYTHAGWARVIYKSAFLPDICYGSLIPSSFD